MKCDELRIENACVYGPDAKVYLAEQVEAAIATLRGANDEKTERIVELQKQVDELKQKLHDAEMRADLAEAAETERKIDYKELKERLRWRKVSEELPEVEEDYGEIFLVAVAVETEKKTKGSYVTSAEFCNGEWYNDSTGNEIEENIEREDCFYRSKITHWMLMPNAPKEADK